MEILKMEHGFIFFLLQIDQVLSQLEEFEITKLYCLVFSNEMKDKMPSCNMSAGSATTTSIAGIVATLAFIVLSLY